jgi:3-hydroxyisobutyrate dehydrogenase
MARNLVKAGFTVRAWNRTRAKAEPLAADGATIADDPVDAARGADILVTMLMDGPATLETGRAAAAALPKGGVWVQMGTIGTAAHDEIALIAKEHGLHLVDAPVSGTRGPAEQGKLVVLASGPASIRDQVQPLFDTLGQRTLWVSENSEHGDGTRLKLAVNAWVLAIGAAIGESLAIADTLGVDPQLVLDTLKGAGTDSPYAQTKGSAILNNELAPQFGLDAAYKDSQLISEAIGDKLRLDIADAASDRYRRAAEAGHGNEDMAAAYFASFPER